MIHGGETTVTCEPMLALYGRQVSKLTGLSSRTLRRWEQTGVYLPSYVDRRPRVPFRRIYSFRDVVSLRALANLRKQRKISLQELRRAGGYLARQYESPWSQLRFGDVDGRLVFRDPVTGKWMDTRGQRVLEISLDDLPAEVERDAMQFTKRTADQIGHITKNRYVQHNVPIIAGTRIPTSTIWAFHEAGYCPDEIIAEYPQLTEGDIAAALAHERHRREAA